MIHRNFSSNLVEFKSRQLYHVSFLHVVGGSERPVLESGPISCGAISH